MPRYPKAGTYAGKECHARLQQQRPSRSHAATLLLGMTRHWPPLELARMLVGEATPAGKSVPEAQPALLGCLAAPLAQHALTRATLEEVITPVGPRAAYPVALDPNNMIRAASMESHLRRWRGGFPHFVLHSPWHSTSVTRPAVI